MVGMTQNEIEEPYYFIDFIFNMLMHEDEEKELEVKEPSSDTSDK